MLTRYFLFCLMTLSLAAPALADIVYVAPVEGVGVDADKLEALRELFKSHVNSSSHTTTDVPQGADFTIQSKLVKVSSFNLTMTKLKGPEKIKSTSWRAANFPALETVSQKAILKTLGGLKGVMKGDNNLGQKVEERRETKATNEKVVSPKQIRIGFGPSFFNNFNTGSSGISFLGGYYWNINDNVDLGLHADFAIAPDAADVNMFTTRIVGHYFPIVLGETSPYVGAGFGYGFASTHDIGTSEKAGGFTGSLQLGAKFFRTSTVNLGVGFDYGILFKSTESYGIPSRFIFHVDLYF